MPNWKKVITSGSIASLDTLTVSNGITGSLLATALTFTSTAVSGLTINKLTTAQRQALTPVIGDVVYDTTIGTTCTYTGTFWQYTKEYYVTSYVTTTTTLASAITGLTTFVLEASSSYSIDGKFFIQCNNNGGIKFGNSLPVGASSRINYWGIGASSQQSQQAGTNDGALTTIGINRVNFSSHLTFGGMITTVANAGSIDINFASSIGGQTSTIYGLFSLGRQSKITLTKIA
jgi:hypothetical protein